MEESTKNLGKTKISKVKWKGQRDLHREMEETVPRVNDKNYVTEKDVVKILKNRSRKKHDAK